MTTWKITMVLVLLVGLSAPVIAGAGDPKPGQCPLCDQLAAEREQRALNVSGDKDLPSDAQPVQVNKAKTNKSGSAAGVPTGDKITEPVVQQMPGKK